MTEHPQGVAGVFDRAAGTYDAVGVDWFQPIARALVDRLAPQPGERALDVGCGRGAALLPLAQAVGPTGLALGIDLAPRMVAATAADLAHLPQVEVRLADAAAPGLPASSYDVVCASLVLFFLPDPGAGARTWHDLLVPGGRLGISTFGPQQPAWQQVDELFEPFLPPRMLDARASGRRGPFATDGGVEDLLAGTGLLEVTTSHVEVRPVFTGADHWHAWSWSHGQRALWEAVPRERHAELRAQAAALLEPLRSPDGTITLSQDVRLTTGRRAG